MVFCVQLHGCPRAAVLWTLSAALLDVGAPGLAHASRIFQPHPERRRLAWTPPVTCASQRTGGSDRIPRAWVRYTAAQPAYLRESAIPRVRLPGRRMSLPNAGETVSSPVAPEREATSAQYKGGARGGRQVWRGDLQGWLLKA